MDDAIAGYFSAGAAARFFIDTAFRHIEAAAEADVGELIFEERMQSIRPDSSPGQSDVPTALPDFIEYMDSVLLSERDVAVVAHVWHSSRSEAGSSGVKLDRKHAFDSPEILGHVINLAACVETAVNQHLFLLKESGKLDDLPYASLDRTEVLPKVLFAFKDEILAKRMHTSRLTHLFRMRNAAVHLKPSTRQALHPTVEELLGIWQEIGVLFEALGDTISGGAEREHLDEPVNAVQSRWFKQ